jgi:hypothetical protein
VPWPAGGKAKCATWHRNSRNNPSSARVGIELLLDNSSNPTKELEFLCSASTLHRNLAQETEIYVGHTFENVNGTFHICPNAAT